MSRDVFPPSVSSDLCALNTFRTHLHCHRCLKFFCLCSRAVATPQFSSRASLQRCSTCNPFVFAHTANVFPVQKEIQTSIHLEIVKERKREEKKTKSDLVVRAITKPELNHYRPRDILREITIRSRYNIFRVRDCLKNA